MLWSVSHRAHINSPWRRIVDARLLPLLLDDHKTQGSRLLLWLLSVGWLLAAALAAQPQAADETVVTGVEEPIVVQERLTVTDTRLRGEPEPFDIVSLAPPYAAGLQGPCAQLLAERGWLARGALVYLEADSGGTDPAWPAHWRLRRRKQAGQVSFCLLQTDVE